MAIVGLPNAGKSSLLNRFLGSKLSIVTTAAQTTRERVVGIDTRNGVQIVFMDTPGVVNPAYLLHHAMLGIVQQTLVDADVVVLAVDGSRPPPGFPPAVEESLARSADGLIVALNKSDIAPPEGLMRLEAWARDRFQAAPVRVSAETGAGVETLRERIGELLPVSPFLYPDDDLSTQSVRFFVAELIRETVFQHYAEEVPYSVAVRVEEFREGSDPWYIRATIFVERSSQKGILIGKDGTAIRRLGSVSRSKIEAFLEQRVYLDLWIKVLPRWRKDSLELQRLGFRVPSERPGTQ